MATHGGREVLPPKCCALLSSGVLVILGRFKHAKTATAAKTSLKSEFGLLQTLQRLLHLVQFVKYWSIFLWLNSKWLYRSSGKEEKSRCLVFKSSTKRKMRHFHVVVVYWRQRNFCTKKRDARAKLLFCLSYPIAFLPLSLPSPWSLLKLPRCNAKPSIDRKSSNSLKPFIFHFARFPLFFLGEYITWPLIINHCLKSWWRLWL